MKASRSQNDEPRAANGDVQPASVSSFYLLLLNQARITLSCIGSDVSVGDLGVHVPHRVEVVNLARASE